MVYWIIFGIVIFAGLAMTVREGLWSNTITLFNVLFSGVVAFGFFQPIVVYLDEELTDGQHTYWLDFAVLWALFSATIVICRALTGALSKTKMRFKHPIDPVGGPTVGLLVAWVLGAFTLATLHVAPMPKDAFSGKLVSALEVDTASLLTSPDAAWLRFVAKMSDASAMGAGSTTRFSARQFVTIYADHRSKFMETPDFIVKRGS